VFFEAYFDQKIDICGGDMLDVLESRHDWASFQFTVGHLQFLAKNLLPEALFHSRSQDESQVREHYDRGNDFYDAFLGPMMIYTSGILTDMDSRQSLEQMQENKLNLVLNKIQLKPDEKLLDIGCGWGTLVAHAAKNFGAKATGVTLAREQTEFGLQRAKDVRL
jgi:cyclopropane fatty-acyl-phospholipid synthase-like methyltransferase